MTLKGGLFMDSIDAISKLETAINNLQHSAKTFNMNVIDAVTMENMKNQLFKKKEAAVLQVHTNAITQLSSTGKWQTRLDGKKPRYATYEALIEKLYNHYYGDDTEVVKDFSFKHIFDLAIKEKMAEKCRKEKTIRDDNNSYNAFITEEFGKKDIRFIKPSEIKIYIMDQVQKLNLTQKRFYKLKGIFNTVFDYATDPERRYVEFNPVPADNEPYKRFFKHSNTRPEDKAFQPDDIKKLKEYLWDHIQHGTYEVMGLAILFSTETGVRQGEIPSLKWSDIDFGRKSIHIHSQQNDRKNAETGKREYYYEPTTKNEKGVSRDGRIIPLTNNIEKILLSLRSKQEKMNIKSEWVFSKRNGNWITTTGYYTALNRVCKELGLHLSNNHAIRMYYNSYVLIPMGLPVSERAKLLGHSIQVNLNHYTFAKGDDYNLELCERMNSYFDGQNGEISGTDDSYTGAVTHCHPDIIPFPGKKRSPESTKFKASR